ncbi:hypothetical protein JCM8547_000224 [Rhodosporidiobolus lusitaniae]
MTEETTIDTLSLAADPPVLSLPVELLLEILSLSSLPSERGRTLVDLALVCKTFSGPALLLLHRRLSLHTEEQARGLLASLKRAPSPARLASSTRRLALTCEASSSAVPPSLALPILYYCDSLHYLYLYLEGYGEGTKTLLHIRENGGGGMTQLRGFKTTKVRWDQLVDLIGESNKLESLELSNFYHAEQPLQPGQDGDTAVVDSTAAETDEQNPVSSSLSPGGDEGDAALLTVTLPCPRPTLPPPSCLPSFPSLPLAKLTLRSPAILDDLFLSIIVSTSHTLSSLCLVEANCFSKTALVLALRGVPNLAELELSRCRFKGNNPRTLQAAATLPPPANGTPAVTTVALPPPTLAHPLPPSFSASTTDLDPDELATPLDHLASCTPFLHNLTLGSDDLLSSDPGGRGGLALGNVLERLPLQYLSLDLLHPRLGVDELVQAVAKTRGRLEAVAIGKRMRWTSRMLNKAKGECSSLGVVLSGEAVEERLF